MERIDLFLQHDVGKYYENTEKENEMVEKVSELFHMAESYKESIDYASTRNIEKWRKAYRGKLNALNKNTGEESTRKSKQLRKVCYELIESKVDNSIPFPKMSPRKKTDLNLVDVTENYLKFEMDRMLSEQENDRSERATYIDGTTWYKVSWDSMDSGPERSGDLRVEVFLADQIVPEPECKDYRLMNYIFEKSSVSVSRIYDLYGRLVRPTANGCVEIITYYYKNENGIVGRFMYTAGTNQVITWDKDWQIRKIRACTTCDAVVPVASHCPNCGREKFKYRNATKEILSEDLMRLYNPYEAGETNDDTQTAAGQVFIKAGTEIPFYQIRQLPFVPRPAVSSLETIYGISESDLSLDMQDSINKILTKVEDKILKSGAVVTKPQRMKLTDKDESFKVMSVNSAEEASQVQIKQIMADVSQDIAGTTLFYESARASSGVTESYQGKRDTTATSGKAKELSAAQSAGRIESLRVMKAAAFQGVYELMFKYLLAFSDETRYFVKVLPDGQQEEMMWNKYMFLRRDKHGSLYYVDDFAFSTDPAATLSNNRVQMWQETLQQFTMGAFGNPQDPRTLEMYWTIMDTMQYPLAKLALAGIKNASQHIPPELEQALMQNPEILQTAAGLVNEMERGSGSRGPEGNGQTHAANVNKTNARNAAATERQSDANMAQMSGGNIG